LFLWLLSILSEVLNIFAYAFSLFCSLENATDTNRRLNLSLVGSFFFALTYSSSD
jgi:hypothetical protein